MALLPTPRPGWLHATLIASLLAALAVAAVLRSSAGTRLDGFTIDEPWHIVAGASYVRSGDFRLNPEHPPLVKLWVGAAMPAGLQLRPHAPLLEKAQERDMVEETVYYDNDARAVQQRARVAMWAFHGLLLLGFGLALWRAFGAAWAAASLAFLAIDPTVAAHLPVVMTDLPMALALLLAALAAGLLAATWRWRFAIGLGVATGLALGAKHSALAGLFGIAVLLAAALLPMLRKRDWRQAGARVAKLAVAMLVAYALLWAMYGFGFHAGPDGSDAFNRPLAGKIAELNSRHWREGIAFADRAQLLPRAYLWGLADTVRTGVEGRAITEHFVWGTMYQGDPPWFSWPAIVVAKLPLPLLLLSLLGAMSLWRARLAPAAKWALAAVAAATAAHMLALVGSGALWGGVRHAMPVLVALAVLGGAAAQRAWQARSVALGGLVVALLIAALALTIRTPRAWEYHNELVGGADGAHRYFLNEGLDLGQRFEELRGFYHDTIGPSGEPLYVGTQVVEELLRGGGMDYRRRVESLHDANTDGIYEGWFLYDRSSRLPWPSWDWNPDEVFHGLRQVAAFGNLQVWHGRQALPKLRADSLSERVFDYIYKERGEDWPLVARRLEEVVAIYPQAMGSGIELGNAYLRMGDGPAAIRSYRRFLDQKKREVDPDIRRQAEALIARIQAAPPEDVAKLEPMRNPWLE